MKAKLCFLIFLVIAFLGCNTDERKQNQEDSQIDSLNARVDSEHYSKNQQTTQIVRKSDPLDQYFFEYDKTRGTDGEATQLRVYRKEDGGKKHLVRTYKFASEIIELAKVDLDYDGKKELFITFYSGGAHCCFKQIAYHVKEGELLPLDTLFGGESQFRIVDLDQDSIKELKGFQGGYAYLFAAYGHSWYPIQIFQFQNGKFVEATRQFPQEIKKDLAVLQKEAEKIRKEIIDKGYPCPRLDKLRENWFDHTDNDTCYSYDRLKAILAPILEDYYFLGQWNEGVRYVKQMYNCADVDSFISLIRKEILDGR